MRPLIRKDGKTKQGDLGEVIHAAASKGTPADADELAVADSQASWSLKKLTWGNLKAAIWAAFKAIATGGSAKGTLGLGTAATKNVGTDRGNVMQVGAFGLGVTPTTIILNGSLTPSQIFAAAENDLPTEWGVSRHTGGWIVNRGNRPIAFFFGNKRELFMSRFDGSNWESPFEFITTGNILSTTGQSASYPMTQKAVTDAINGVSDRRDKLDITPNDVGLNLIEKLEPVSFKLNKRDWYRKQAATSFETHTDEEGAQTEVEKINPDVLTNPLTDYDNNDGSLARNDRYTGLIAQDVKAALEDLGMGDLAIIKNYSDEYEGGDDRHYIEYNGLIPIMINAIKELNERVKVLEAKL